MPTANAIDCTFCNYCLLTHETNLTQADKNFRGRGKGKSGKEEIWAGSGYETAIE
jgi:hypothetical protein